MEILVAEQVRREHKIRLKPIQEALIKKQREEINKKIKSAMNDKYEYVYFFAIERSLADEYITNGFTVSDCFNYGKGYRISWES